MKTHLTTTLQQLVLVDMRTDQPAMKPEQIADITARFPEIQSEIFDILQWAVFGRHPMKIMCRHVNQILKECTLMLDALYNYTYSCTEMQDLRESVIKFLLQIIEHQQIRYTKYLDSNAAMPRFLFKEAAQRIEKNTVVMVSAMTRYHADKKLQVLLVIKMASLLKEGSGTWHKMQYLEKLQKSIMELCSGSNTNITHQLRILLLRANFNTAAFISYCKTEIDEQKAQNFEYQEQCNCLHEYKRELATRTDNHKFDRFEPKELKVRTILSNYIDLELQIMDRNRPPAPAPILQNKPDLQQQAKLPLSISVDALAYLFRLLLSAAVVSGPKSELLLFLSRNFRTPGVSDGDLSLKSLNNKYKQVVKRTAITVRSILLNMLKQIDEEFG